MKELQIYTDGACRGNPGPGAYGVVIKMGEKVKELSGAAEHTTNNRMELTAAIVALEALKEPCLVDLTSDSKYVIQGITEWIIGWKSRGWRNASKKPVVNRDLWEQLDLARKKHKIEWHWVKGHSGHEENERCDELANIAMDNMIG